MSGIALAHDYYRDAVLPILEANLPGLPHAAARLGSGSDVLGLDDGTSRDHDWGLRLTLLVDADQVAAVDELLERELPPAYREHPTRFGTTWHPEPRHQVEVATVAAFTRSRLGVDATREPEIGDWLTLTGQAVLEVTAGEVFADTTGELTAARLRLDWYPDALWRHLLAVDWARIGQELPFVGRTGDRGDELGSRVITARLVRDAMHLGFLLERRWAPYPKWFGTAFASLSRAGAIAGMLRQALAADDWHEREGALCEALEALNALQRDIGLPAAAEATQQFFDRPYRGVTGTPELLRESIADPTVRALPADVGSIEQWVDDVAVLTSAQRRAAVEDALVAGSASAGSVAE